jgi:hypothetical protein
VVEGVAGRGVTDEEHPLAVVVAAQLGEQLGDPVGDLPIALTTGERGVDARSALGVHLVDGGTGEGAEVALAQRGSVRRGTVDPRTRRPPSAPPGAGPS